jgi:aryl-alcohol dehydrogenase-like predicted oxidoreductase
MPDTYGYGVDEARAQATVAAIFDGPTNFIDTSRIYGSGRSEERIGAVIRDPPGFVISSKLDRDPDTGRFDSSQARLPCKRPRATRPPSERAGDPLASRGAEAPEVRVKQTQSVSRHQPEFLAVRRPSIALLT